MNRRDGKRGCCSVPSYADAQSDTGPAEPSGQPLASLSAQAPCRIRTGPFASMMGNRNNLVNRDVSVFEGASFCGCPMSAFGIQPSCKPKMNISAHADWRPEHFVFARTQSLALRD